METLFESTRELMHGLTETIFYLRDTEDIEVFFSVGIIVDRLQIYIGNLKENGLENETERLYSLLQTILEAMQSQDREKIEVLLSKNLVSILYRLQESIFGETDGILKDYWGKNRLALREKDRVLYRNILSVKDNISDAYQLSWARTGDLVLTVETEQGAVRVNSSGDPWQEALLFIKGEVQENNMECVVVGFGMGYHIEILARQSGIKRIIVLENDLAQLAIALSYRNLSKILSDGRISILHSSKPEEYSKWLNGDEDRMRCIWYPSIKTICERTLRESLENYWIELASVKKMGAVLEQNFVKNIEKNDEEVFALKEKFCNKTMFFVAAGPSLEDSIGQLKLLERSQFVLVCVGKVARRLLQQEIYPDYIVMTDGLAGTIWQIRGIEDCMVPLIYLSTVASDVVDLYQGKRYIAFQEGFPPAENYAREKGYLLYQSGGSVATFAIDLGIRMGCNRIICLGLDMGYTDKRSHAFGIGASVSEYKNLRKVEGIISDYIYTSKTLDIYRQWIERRIKEEKKTEFINVSEGARIHGMKEKELKNCFSNKMMKEEDKG